MWAVIAKASAQAQLAGVSAQPALEAQAFHAPERRAVANMIERLRAGGSRDERVLAAFAQVPRHRFVPDRTGAEAYRNMAEPIGYGQTISQPSMLALMLEELELEPNQRVLEIGAGSGYAAALLSHLAGEVFALEIVPELARSASERMRLLGYDNVQVLLADGNAGLPDQAPFDRILVSAAPRSVPDPLLAQLAPSGRIVIPVGDRLDQHLQIGVKDEAGAISWRASTRCIFVPLVSG